MSSIYRTKATFSVQDDCSLQTLKFYLKGNFCSTALSQILQQADIHALYNILRLTGIFFK